MARRIKYAEDDKEPIKMLFKLRLPSLFLGLILGLVLSFVTSKFQTVLEHNITLAFFIPFVVYLADAVGTQTENIYVRELKTGKAKFKTYLAKETTLGMMLGILFSTLTFIIVAVWFNNIQLALAISLGILGAVISAPPLAVIIAELLELEKEDPAVWAGPLATVVQDTVSILIYGLIATAILL